MKLIIPFIFVIILFTLSCNKDGTFTVESGFEYFPTEVGKWWEYEADSMVWNAFKNDTTYTVSFFVREEIVDEFIDSQGRDAITISRSYSWDGADWKKRNTWSALKDEHFAERVEDNTRFIKLAFPLLVGKKWKGNSYINHTTLNKINGVMLNPEGWDWDYSVQTLEGIYENGDLSFTNVAEIKQEPAFAETLLQKVMGVEQYAKGVGLVYKKLTVLDNVDGDAIPWPDRTENGFIYTQRLIKHN